MGHLWRRIRNRNEWEYPAYFGWGCSLFVYTPATTTVVGSFIVRANVDIAAGTIHGIAWMGIGGAQHEGAFAGSNGQWGLSCSFCTEKMVWLRLSHDNPVFDNDILSPDGATFARDATSEGLLVDFLTTQGAFGGTATRPA